MGAKGLRRSVSHIIVAFVPCSCLAVAGCGAGIVGAVLGVQSKSGGGGTTDSPPAKPDFKEVERVDGDHVLVTYTLLDDHGGPLGIEVEYQPVGGDGRETGPWSPATECRDPVTIAPGSTVSSDGVSGLTVEPNAPRTFRFIWEARKDLLGKEGVGVQSVRLRMTASEEGGAHGDPGLSGVFIAGNIPPKVISITPGALGGVIPLEVVLADSTSDPVTLDCRYRIGDGPWTPMTILGAGPDTRFETLPKEEGGKRATVFWDSRANLGLGALPGVVVEITPRDFEAGTAASLGPIEVDNNSEPQVQLLDLSGAEDRSFEVPIRFIVRDEEEQPVSVVLQWAAGNDDFPAIPFPETLSDADLASLRDLLTSDDPAQVQRRKDLHILSEAPRIFRGTVDAADGLPDGQVRLTDLARSGLVFVAPTELASRPLPPPPFDAASEVFVIGQEIRFTSPGSAPGPWRRIAAFDPKTSVAALDGPADAPQGSTYELQARRGLSRLPSSRAGLLHVLVWDSSRDLEGTGWDGESPIRIQAVGIDSQVGPPTPQESIIPRIARFRKGKSIPFGKNAEWVAIGDLNGDGRNDVVIDSWNSGSAQVYLQKASGDLPDEPSWTLKIGKEMYQVAIGDLNGDGRNDVAMANWRDQTIDIYLQDEKGKLPVEVSFQIHIEGSDTMAIGDVDGDGLADLVATTWTPPYGAYVFLQDWDSGLSSEPSIHLAPSATCYTEYVALGDFDGDGRDDVVASEGCSNNVDVYCRIDRSAKEMAPTWVLKTSSASEATTPFFAIGDLDGDGRLDLAVECYNEKSVYIYYYEEKDGTGGRLPDSPQATLATGDNPCFPAIGDLNGDGRNDLAVPFRGSSEIGIYFQDASGKLPGKPDLSLPADQSVALVTIGDIDGDGRDDLISNSLQADTVTVYFQDGPGLIPSAPARTLLAGGSPQSLLLADANADGRIDLVSAEFNTGCISIYHCSASGSLPTHPDAGLEAGKGPLSVVSADLDGDGRNDIAAAFFESGQVGIYRQASDGKLPPRPDTLLSVEGRPHAVALGDLHGDGRIDLAVADLDSRVVTIFRQDGNGSHPDRPDVVLATGDRPFELAVGDLDGDGRRDLAVASADSNRVLVFFQSASGGFPATPGATLSTKGLPLGLALGDLNGDGVSDLAVAEFDSGTASVFLQASGGLPVEPTRTVQAGEGPLGLSIGDVNGDGRSDLLVGCFGADAVRVFFQTPRGGLPERVGETFRGTDHPGAIAVGDINGDGRNDVVVASRERPEGAAYFLGLYLAR